MKTGPGDPADVRVAPAEYVVTIWPEGHDCVESSQWCLVVRERRHGQWSVEQGRATGPRLVLGRDGHWVLDRPGDTALRFPLAEALQAAKQRAASFTSCGRTPADVLKDHADRGCTE